jgi:NADH-quinone oxidoreductase subunit M
MFMGEYWLSEPAYHERLTDLRGRETVLLGICVVLSILWGVYPAFLFDIAQDSVNTLLRLIP